MPRRLLFTLLSAVLLTSNHPALGQARLDGYLIATEACPATRAIRDGDSADPVRLEIGRAYPLLGENRRGGTHLLVEVEGAEPERRWTARTCGRRVAVVEDLPALPDAAGTAARPAENRRDTGDPEYVLAISWQPAFCETRPETPECTSQGPGRFDASNFTLHGLWPQPRGREYCGVEASVRAADRPESWSRLPAPELSLATREALQRVMPGTQSALDRHEWVKHGTCYGARAEEYFSDSIMLLEAINATDIRALFADHVGQVLSGEAIRRSFDEAFGEGAGRRVRLSCYRDGERRVLGELTIGLSGEVTPDSDIGALILAAPPTGNAGCAEGVVDAVGLQ